MTNRKATAKEIRGHYRDQGHIAHISRNGHVQYRADGRGPWLEGRWIEDYIFSDEHGVVCP